MTSRSWPPEGKKTASSGDLMYTYKIFGLVDLDCSRFFTVSSNETTRGHTCKLFVCHSRVDVRKYFLCNRVVKVWNSLPATSDDFTSIRSFSSLIKRTDLSRFVFIAFESFVLFLYFCCSLLFSFFLWLCHMMFDLYVLLCL